MPMLPLSENSSLSPTMAIRRMGVYLQQSRTDNLRQGRSDIREFSYDAYGNMTQDASFGLGHSNIYQSRLNLVTAIGYKKRADGESAACHEYDYDALMCSVQRRDSWNVVTPEMLRDFTYNSRSELIEDRISQGGSFSYQYDNIDNRKTTWELEKEVAYESNPLNQYADIAGGEEHFKPVYNVDSNRTKSRTSTGIWEVNYDANAAL